MNENKERCQKIRLNGKVGYVLEVLALTSALIAIISGLIMILLAYKQDELAILVCYLIFSPSGIIACILAILFSLSSVEITVVTRPAQKPLAEAIPSDHGSNLETVMEAIRNEPLEYRAIFDANGNKLVEGTLLSPKRCNVVEDDRSKVRYAEVDLHNHPGVYETAFSDDDLKVLIGWRIRQMVVVTQNYTYIIENPYWREDKSVVYPFNINEFNEFVDKKYQFPFIVKFLARFSRSTFRWYIAYCVHSVARRYGLKFHVQNHRLERLKKSLWTRKVQRKIIGYATALGMTVLAIFTPSTSSPIRSTYRNYVIAKESKESNTAADQNLRTVSVEELAREHNSEYIASGF